MKRKILAFTLAVMTFTGSVAFATTPVKPSRVIIMCYDDSGALVYSGLYWDTYTVSDIPEEYRDMKKKAYIVDAGELTDITELPDDAAETPAPSPTETPSATEAPSATEEPSPTEAAQTKYPSIYEKGLDAIYAPAVVDEVELTTNSSEEEIYSVKALMRGEEMTIPIETDIEIQSAPEAYGYLAGQNADVLERGDVICVTTNVAGDRIKTLDLLFRPAEEDIITGGNDYGTNFERLFTSDGKTAGQWTAMKYGEKASSDRYQYAFGVVGKKSGGALTLINAGADIDEAIEVSLQSDTIVYLCDTDGKEYSLEIGGAGDISTSIPASKLNNGELVLDDTYAYNYALVRVVDGIATDIVVYENYNN